jgi:transcriptional regulator with XRE-family HTH domain
MVATKLDQVATATVSVVSSSGSVTMRATNRRSRVSDDEGLGPRLRELRGDRSLRDVAKQAGVNHGYLSQLERGEITAPAPAILQRLAKGYGVPFPVLMNWAGYMESGLSANQERALSYLGSDVSDDELELVRAFLDAIRKPRVSRCHPETARHLQQP